MRVDAESANSDPWQKLTAVTANRHVFEGRANGRPLRLLLTFDDGRMLRLKVAGDGYRMVLDNLPLDAPFDMGEYGTVIAEDVTDLLHPRLRGAELESARELRLDGDLVGLQLRLTNGDSFHFWADGDELFWGDQTSLIAHDWLAGSVPTAGNRVSLG